MTIYQVPIDVTYPWFKQRMILSGTIYVLYFRYNTRTTRWEMDINDSSENPLLTGIVLLIDTNLTTQYPELVLPPGVFFVIDNSGQQTQPTRYSFGVSHTLLYNDPDS